MRGDALPQPTTVVNGRRRFREGVEVPSWGVQPGPSTSVFGTKYSKLLLQSEYLFYKIEPMPIGSLELSALLSVVRLGDEAYGLAVRADLAERTGRELSVGAVYTTLQRLEDKGFLRSHASAPLPVRGGRSRRHYVLTGAGGKAIRDAERHAKSIWQGVRSPVRPRPA